MPDYSVYPATDFVLQYEDAIVYKKSYGSYQWVNTSFKTISIVGGDDSTNTSLIAWLQANGTLELAPQPKTYNITVNASHIDVTGPSTITERTTVQLTLTAQEHYNLPDTVKVLNATSSYFIQSGVGYVDLTVPTNNVIITASAVEKTHSLTRNFSNIHANIVIPNIISELETINFILVPAEHYLLPETITVSGATYTYNNLTGEVTIHSATSNVHISASGIEIPPPPAIVQNLIFGENPCDNMFIGDASIDAIYFGSNLVFKAGISEPYYQKVTTDNFNQLCTGTNGKYLFVAVSNGIPYIFNPLYSPVDNAGNNFKWKFYERDIGIDLTKLAYDEDITEPAEITINFTDLNRITLKTSDNKYLGNSAYNTNKLIKQNTPLYNTIETNIYDDSGSTWFIIANNTSTRLKSNTGDNRRFRFMKDYIVAERILIFKRMN